LKPDQINFTDTSPTNELQDPTQRHYFGQCAVGLGTIAVNCLLARDGIAAPRRPQIDPAKPMAPRKPPQPAKAKRVIDLFMAGAPSQLELFEDKPKLRELSRLPPPPSLMKGKRFAFLKGNETLMGTRRKFAQYGQSGATLSELLPNHQKIADDVTWLQGKILIDATNPLGMTEKGLALATGFSTSGAEKKAALAPAARLVKCFNQTGFGNMAEPRQSVMFVCGDDASANETVRQLAAEIGFDAIAIGALDKARLLEPLAMLWIHLSMATPLHRDFAFGLLRR
jgi:hypothetical protein